ncbi:hypothetical protein ACT3CD_06350 [Geofilum sp. OHC36d9]|uniref:hypothetical protein n=1 Tax=Geofilum sp. OHC36d9 TaxID=3458413 RepID=UPI004034C8F2
MTKGDILLVDLEFEYKLWRNRLKCYIEEVNIVLMRNSAITSNRPLRALNEVEVMVLEEHQAQLKQLLNRITVQEQEMQYYNKDFPVMKNHQYVEQYLVICDKMGRLGTIHNERMEDLVKAIGL